MPDPYMDDINSDINRKKQIEGNQKYKPFSQEIKAINKADKAGNLTDQDRIEGHKRASNIYRGIEEQSSGSPVGDDIITKARLTFNKLSPYVPVVKQIREIFKPWFDTDSQGNISFNPNKVTAENYLESTRSLITYQIQNPGMGYLPASEEPALAPYSGQIETIKRQRFTPEQLVLLKDQLLQAIGDGGFSERSGRKIARQKQEQPNIFTNPVTGRAIKGFRAEKELMDNEIEAFALDLFSKGKTGYKSLGAFRSKIVNRLDPYQKLELYQTLTEGPNLQGGYIEHMIQKSPAMDWYWNMKNQDRDGLQNVRIAFDNRLKVLKDIAEGIVHGRTTSKGFKKGLGWQTDNLENRIIVSFEDPDKRSFVFNKTGLGNIVLRRAGSNKLLGKLGQYLASLYPQDQGIAAQLDSDIRNYITSENITITVKTTSGKDKVRPPTVAEWKKGFLVNRIKLIIDEAPGLSGMSEERRNLFIDNEINKDMIQLRQEFPFLPQEQTNPQTEVMEDPYLSEEGYLKRGQKGKHIVPPFKDIEKTEQFNPRQYDWIKDIRAEDIDE